MYHKINPNLDLIGLHFFKSAFESQQFLENIHIFPKKKINKPVQKQ